MYIFSRKEFARLFGVHAQSHLGSESPRLPASRERRNQVNEVDMGHPDLLDRDADDGISNSGMSRKPRYSRSGTLSVYLEQAQRPYA
jgi:hypothetical protein